MSKKPRPRRPQTAAKIFVLHASVCDHNVTSIATPEQPRWVDGLTLRQVGLRLNNWQLVPSDRLMARWLVAEVMRGPHKGRFWAIRGDWFKYESRGRGDPREWWAVTEHVGFPTKEAAIMWAVLQ